MDIGLFPHFGTVSHAVMNVCVHVFVAYEFSVLQGIFLEVEFLDNMIILCLTFWGTNKMLSTIQSVAFYIPALNV